MDHEIWLALWRWARRRHPKKSRDWVKKHCFPTLRNRAWTFACKTEKQTPDGRPVWLRLVYAGETKIRRHVKIRKNANPFDPQWQDYLAERAFQKKFGITRREAGIKPPEISDELFTYCLEEFWSSRFPNSQTLPFREVSVGEGSPGQVFKLPELYVRERLERIDASKKSPFAFDDSASAQRLRRKGEIDKWELLDRMYGNEEE